MDEIISTIDETILKLEQIPMDTSEQEGFTYVGGYLGRKDSNLARKSKDIDDPKEFIASKWIDLKSKGGLTYPAQQFSEDLVKMDAVFRAFHDSADDGLIRHKGVVGKLTEILQQKFSQYDTAVLRKFALSRTVFRMRNMQRHRHSVFTKFCLIFPNDFSSYYFSDLALCNSKYVF